jgi:hypothetical protein
MEFWFQPLSYFLKQDGRRADKVGYFPRPRVSRQGTDQHAPYCRNACVLLEGASEQLLKARSTRSSCYLETDLGWKRRNLPSTKLVHAVSVSRDSSHYKASEVLQRKTPKNKALQSARRQSSTSAATVQTDNSTISICKQIESRSVQIACHSAAGATSATTSKFLATLISLLGSSWDQWSSWANLAPDDDTPTTTCHAEKAPPVGPDYILDEDQVQVLAKSLNPNLCSEKIWWSDQYVYHT